MKFHQFLDAMQERLEKLCLDKYNLDESSNKGKRGRDNPLDKNSLFLELAAAHDAVAQIPFNRLLDKGFVISLLKEVADPKYAPLRPLYIQYVSLIPELETDMASVLATYILHDVTRPLITQDRNGVLLSFDHGAVTDRKEYEAIGASLVKELSLNHYIRFLMVISMTRIYLPLEGDD